MKRIIFCLIISLSFSNCKSSKRAKNKSASSKIVIKKNTDKATAYTKPNSEHIIIPKTKETPRSKAEHIIAYAKQFKGVRYKWGGTTKSGMDCSGLVYESFKTQNIALPRISRDMAKKGKKIPLKKVTQGDLLFFKTGNRRNSINHVGLIIAIKNNSIEFIHATSSKGVITSSLNEKYWHKAFYEARRIL
ncbi:C40 family peptidase [Tamlana sp. 2201CG12-4]|uniref:C40 family peptidase n=1 Tax=Tamlana sp. 2201CG12-4 TaxID=3112582 RepID=UPI002DBD90F4|nr:C40 family peptidase [Tamlana sp. 2201CG12-4]MEC3907066.1 C40 family peptidase [Tamlana sp. 2201CG12-4]